jgi:hypothetical protein
MPEVPDQTIVPAVPNNSNDHFSAVTKIITLQAEARAGYVDLIIAWHLQLAAVDAYLQKLQQAIKYADEYATSVKATLMEPARLAAHKQNAEVSYGNWRATLERKYLPEMLKMMPEALPLDVVRNFTVALHSWHWGEFKRVFKTFLCGPVEMSMLKLDANTQTDFLAAIFYARDTGRITIPTALLSFQSA